MHCNYRRADGVKLRNLTQKISKCLPTIEFLFTSQLREQNIYPYIFIYKYKLLCSVRVNGLNDLYDLLRKKMSSLASVSDTHIRGSMGQYQYPDWLLYMIASLLATVKTVSCFMSGSHLHRLLYFLSVN